MAVVKCVELFTCETHVNKTLQIIIMEPATKFQLPSPNFNKVQEVSKVSRPHFLTPCGMTLLPREKQPPPMYGPRGATLPPVHLKAHQSQNEGIITESVFCEPCEMEFHTQQDYRRHRQQHEKCPVDDCQFRGHYSVMDRHVMALHSSGLFEQVKRVSTPDEIAAWREERRKKYPSIENVKLRQQAQEERVKRGERLEASKNRFGNWKDRKRPFENKTEEQKTNQNKNKRQRKQKRRNAFKTQQTKEEKTVSPTLQNDNDAVKSGEEKTNEQQVNGLSLLSMYESDEEENEQKHESPIVEKIKTVVVTTENAKIESIEEENLSDDAPEEAPIERKSNIPPPVEKSQQQEVSNNFSRKPPLKRKFVRKSGLNYKNLYKPKQNTMLEKLLETEIRHERNVLLQCVRFVVDKQFFGIGSTENVVSKAI